MRSAETIKNWIKNTKIKTNPKVNKAVLDGLLNQMDQAEGAEVIAPQQNTWRIIMQSRITKFATAAVIIIAALLSITFLDKTVTPAYAIEQTIEAYSSIRWLHAKEFYMVGKEKRPSELWIGFDDYGRLSKFRHHAPNSMGPQLGSITIVNGGNETYAWLENFNLCFRTPGPPEPDDASLLLQWEISEIDPKLVCERLYEQESRGEILLEVNEPEHKNEPIVLVVTYPKGSLSENWKKMLYIDQATSLVKKAEKFEMRDGQYQHVRTVEFFDYNQPIDPDIFSLDGELPEDVIWIDQSDKVIGLAQGDMTDEEIAAEVTLQFAQASIDKDYNKVGQLFQGVPGFLVEKLSNGNVLEIISVGPAYPYSDPDSNMMMCSCKSLGEAGGRYYEFDTTMWLRPVPGQPGRWMASGISTNATPVSDEELETLDRYLDTDPSCVTYNGFEPGVFMQDWLVLGSIPVFDEELTIKEKFSDGQTQLQAFDEDPFDIHQFEPTVIIDDKEYHWEFYHSPSELVDLAGPFGQQNFANAYALAQIEIEQDTPVLLAIGDDDRIKVWLNGELVHKDTMGGHLVPDKAFIPVTLHKGINQLLLKVQNGITEWQFTCRIFEADYDPLEGEMKPELSSVTYDGLEPGKFMTKWLMLGPATAYPYDGEPNWIESKVAFDEDHLESFEYITPTVQIDAKEYAWTAYQSYTGIVNIHRAWPQGPKEVSEYVFAYAWAQVDMPEETTVLLGIGSDDAVKVWLNGELVHEKWGRRGAFPDHDLVSVTFRKGLNQLVFKIQNGQGRWKFCCRLLE